MNELHDLGAKTKTQALRERLIEMSRSLGPGSRFPTVNEMISSFKVSVSTLDRILAELERDGIIERKRGRGIYVSNKSTKELIGIVCDIDIISLLNTYFYGMIMSVLQKVIEDAGYDSQIFIDMRPDENGIPSHSSFLTQTERGEISGVCYIGGASPKMIEWVQKRIPSTVVFGEHTHAKHCFSMDHAEICRIGAREIARLGARRPALLPYWDKGGALFKSCKSAFTKELSEIDAKIEPVVWSCGLSVELETNEAQGYRAVMELFKSKDAVPDGIVSIDDMTTRGVAAGLSSLGLRPGTDVKIVTHVNKGSPALDLYRPHLSLIEIDIDRIASKMLFTLMRVINGDNSPSHELLNCTKLLPANDTPAK